MTNWEYHVTERETDLAQLGRQGWELVAVVPGAIADSPKFYLKRPAQSFREQVTEQQKRRYYASRGIPLQDDRT